MRAKIHRGAHEVGGNCVEVEHSGVRLVLDLGWPLTVAHDADLGLPPVPGLVDGDDRSLLGVVVSHPHFDHYGLLAQVPRRVPVYMGQAASHVLREAAFFTRMGLDVHPAGFLAHRQTLSLGPFTLTSYLNDHSAYDAYSFVVEASGRRLFYTGDLRAHGRKARLFEEFLRDPPRKMDVLLMEGTHIREDGDGTERGDCETAVEAACVETIRRSSGMALAMYSPQNIDRLVTLYRAALRTGRILVMDLYAAAIAAATGRETIPQASWDRVRVYLPRAQKGLIMKAGAFDRTDAVRAKRIYPEELASRTDELVLTFRSSMASELAAAECLEGATAIWSMWPGYLRDASCQSLLDFLERRGIPLVVHHASGHAFIPQLRRLVAAINPTRVVPIHSFAGDRFGDLFPRVDRRHDGEWWEV